MNQIATAITVFLEKDYKQHLTPEFKAFVLGVVYDYLKQDKDVLLEQTGKFKLLSSEEKP